MEQAVKKLSSGNFRECAYRDVGKGFPVVLVHGFPADGTLWDYQAAKLCADFRLLIPDLPGSGGSPLVNPLSIESMACFLHDMVKQERIDHCIMIGHSMGGYITLAFAEQFPQELKGFGLFHSTAFADTAEKKEGRLRSIGLMQQYGAAGFLRQMIPTLFADQYRKNNREKMQAFIKSRENARVEALTAYYRAMMERPDRTSVLQRAKAPVLFVVGDEDSAAPAKDVLQQVSLPAVSDVKLLKAVAHLGMIEAADESAAVLKQFIHFCLELK